MSGELERNLGFLEAMTLGGGTMIGAGIFILPGLAAEGAGPASAISFVIAGFVALLAALSLAELATGMPIAGGSYHYVNRALGGIFGSIVGWGMWTGLMFASAFYMIGFGQYIVGPLAFLDGRALIVLLGLLGLALIVAINFYGTSESSGAQNLMIGAEFLIVLVYVALGLFFIDPSNLREFAPTGVSGIVATTGTVFVTYLGFEIIATVAGEIKNPGRNIPLTMVLSVVSVTILYAIIMIVSTGVVPYEQLGGSLVPVSDVAAVTMFGTVGVAAVTFAAAIAAISSSNSSILAASRVLFAMGRDGLMSDRLNVTHDRFSTPHRAIVATGVITGTLVLAGLRVQTIVALLAQVASFSFLVTYGLVHVALIVFRRADPDQYDPAFRIPGYLYPVVPVLGIGMAVFVVSQMRDVVILLGTGIIGLGILWYFLYASERAVEDGIVDDAVGNPISAASDLLSGTETGSDSAEPYRVVVPVANPATQRRLLRLAAASARAHADERVPELVAVNVIRATHLSPNQNIESERLRHQRELFSTAREIATDLDVELRTRALVGHTIGATVLSVIREEDADQVFVGWRGTPEDASFVFGSTLDPIVRYAPCGVSLVNLRTDDIDAPVALVGQGPNASAVARRAAEFATFDNTVPTLLNIQPAGTDGDDPVTRGEQVITDVAKAAGLDTADYESEVRVAEDVETAVLDAIDEYETVCVGASERRGADQISFGSVAERVGQQSTGNVAVIRGSHDPHQPVEKVVADQ